MGLPRRRVELYTAVGTDERMGKKQTNILCLTFCQREQLMRTEMFWRSNPNFIFLCNILYFLSKTCNLIKNVIPRDLRNHETIVVISQTTLIYLLRRFCDCFIEAFSGTQDLLRLDHIGIVWSKVGYTFRPSDSTSINQ